MFRNAESSILYAHVNSMKMILLTVIIYMTPSVSGPFWQTQRYNPASLTDMKLRHEFLEMTV